VVERILAGRSPHAISAEQSLGHSDQIAMRAEIANIATIVRGQRIEPIMAILAIMAITAIR
jgi:hypothetical protein